MDEIDGKVRDGGLDPNKYLQRLIEVSKKLEYMVKHDALKPVQRYFIKKTLYQLMGYIRFILGLLKR